MNLTSNSLVLSDQLEYVVALALLFCINFASGFPDAVGFREESEFSSRPRKHSGEALFFYIILSSSRSESAMFSVE